MRDSGGRFNYKVGDSERKISIYNQNILISKDFSAEFVTKGLKIVFVPLKDKPSSFSVTKTYDFRSMGGDMREESFIVSFASNEIIYIEFAAELPETDKQNKAQHPTK